MLDPTQVQNAWFMLQHFTTILDILDGSIGIDTVDMPKRKCVKLRVWTGEGLVKVLDDPKSAGFRGSTVYFDGWTYSMIILNPQATENDWQGPLRISPVYLQTCTGDDDIRHTDSSQAERNLLRNAVGACQSCPSLRQWVGCASHDTWQYRVSAWCRDLVETLQYLQFVWWLWIMNYVSLPWFLQPN